MGGMQSPGLNAEKQGVTKKGGTDRGQGCLEGSALEAPFYASPPSLHLSVFTLSLLELSRAKSSIYRFTIPGIPWK
jgi:hypothetical protein